MVELRRTFFTEESKAVKQYVKSLSNATAVLESSINSYPSSISATLESCTQGFGELQGQIHNLAAAASSLDSSKLNASVAAFSLIGSAAGELEASIATLKTSLTSARQAADLLPEGFDRLAGSAGRELEASVASIQASMASVRKAADLVPENLQGQLKDLGHRLNEIPAAAHEQIRILKDDIDSIDHILDTFIVLLQKKVEAIK